MVFYKVLLELVKSVGLFIISLCIFALFLFALDVIPVEIFVVFTLFLVASGIYGYKINSYDDCVAYRSKHDGFLYLCSYKKPLYNSWKFNISTHLVTRSSKMAKTDRRIIASNNYETSMPPLPSKIEMALVASDKVYAKYRMTKNNTIVVYKVKNKK